MRARGWIGLALLAVAWTLNWSLDGLRTHVLFFPLWLGAILAADAWTETRTGTSIWRRSRLAMAALFLLSMPAWWLFEALNERLENWEYVGREHFSSLEYALWSTLCFSTVVPAVLVAAELVSSASWLQRFGRGPVVRAGRGWAGLFAGVGLLQLGAMFAWPRTCYPFAWTSLVFLLEALCFWLGRAGLTADLARGDWRRWMSLWIGGLACGFLWELWNWRSHPSWIYHVPGVEFGHVFAMPILGYLGYLPFAHEVYLMARACLTRSLAERVFRPL
jgi:hypothetical protein